MSYKSPAEIAKEVVSIGEKKSRLSTSNIIVLSILAGVYIAFAGQLMIIATFDVASGMSAGLMRLIGGSVFSVGLILVVIAGAELFTGNSLMTIGWLDKKLKSGALAKNWLLVYLGNFVGSILIVLLVYYSGVWQLAGNAVGLKALGIAVSKAKLDFWQALFLGIGANWLVCIAVWLAISGSTTVDKILAIFFPIMAFVALGFEHSIANMFFLPMGLLLKGVLSVPGVSQLTITSAIFNNLIPVTIGNIIGGVLFVAVPYWYVYIRNTKKPVQVKPEQVTANVVERRVIVRN